MNHRRAHAIAVAGLAGVFAYQGLVPKVWKVDDGELALWEGFGVSRRRATQAVRAVGAVEASFALVTLARSRRRWPALVALATMPMLVAGTTTADHAAPRHAFNPVSLAIAVSALAGVALTTAEP
jgi:hypothetical protein